MFQGFKITKLQSHLVLMLPKENFESFHNCVGLVFRRFNVALQKCQNLLKLLCLKCVLLQCCIASMLGRFTNMSLHHCITSMLFCFTTASLHHCIASPLHRITNASLHHCIGSPLHRFNVMPFQAQLTQSIWWKRLKRRWVSKTIYFCQFGLARVVPGPIL